MGGKVSIELPVGGVCQPAKGPRMKMESDFRIHVVLYEGGKPENDVDEPLQGGGGFRRAVTVVVSAGQWVLYAIVCSGCHGRSYALGMYLCLLPLGKTPCGSSIRLTLLTSWSWVGSLVCPTINTMFRPLS